MKKYNQITPEGTKDILFEECEIRRRLQGDLSALYARRGFSEVQTPDVEFFDVFNSNSLYFPQESMYKLIDQKGRLMVMRPDCTIPIARLTATRLLEQPKPIRLYYNQPVYRLDSALNGKSHVQQQSGLELIGANNLKSDLELLELAVRSLRVTNRQNFRIEICHIGYFKALIDRLDADYTIKEEIRTLIESKNYAALVDLLETFGDSQAALALKSLPKLFGGQEVLGQAAQLFDGANDVLDYLTVLYNHLTRLGLKENVMIDLGLVNQAEYYTGVIFRGYLEGIGEPVLSGGRYDSLLRDFGADLPAVGFAVNIDLVAKSLLGEIAVKKAVPDLLVHSDDDHIIQAFDYIERQSAIGVSCEYSVCGSIPESVALARSRAIRAVHVVGDAVQIIDAMGGNSK